MGKPTEPQISVTDTTDIKVLSAAAPSWSVQTHDPTRMFPNPRNARRAPVALIDNRDFDFFYAYRSSHPEELHKVNAISTLPSQPTKSVTINSTVHKLGMLGLDLFS
ncbi:MAG TPA: hypothetical protein VHZ51_06880 [Ktedonobacteraceae bacterium]|jgi:hypothetical protein|nr:hypothetical protein [Ktedonobacteraceae bacterium]